MTKKNTAELALEFGRLMTEMRNHVRQQIQLKIKEDGLNITFELLEIMALLWRRDGVNQQELADMAIKDKSSMTYLINNLVKRDLVSRVGDELDGRNKLVFLTEKGKQLRGKIYPWVTATYLKATTQTDAAEIENAILLVKKMTDNLKK